MTSQDCDQLSVHVSCENQQPKIVFENNETTPQDAAIMIPPGGQIIDPDTGEAIYTNETGGLKKKYMRIP